jgi:hypothetical protein
MELRQSVLQSMRPYAAEGLDGRCGYCGRRLASVAFIYTRARPACGSAWCLQQALQDSEKTEKRAA